MSNQEERARLDFSSKLSEQDRTIDQIRRSASGLLQAFKTKLNALKGNNELTEKILRQGLDKQGCFKEAIKFFEKDEVRYLAIDGTEFQDDRMDMLIFYAGAFGYGGSIRFSESDGAIAEPPRSEEDSFSLSAAIPLSDEYASAVMGQNTESGLEVDIERVPSSLMRLAEYYLAYSSIKHDERNRIVILDRSVSGDIAHIGWKMRDYIKEGVCFLEGYKTANGQISRSDLELGRMLISSRELKIPAPRSQQLKFAAMKSLMDSGQSMTMAQIAASLGASKERETKIMQELKSDFSDSLIIDRNSETNSLEIELRPSVKFYWERLLDATLQSVDRIFNPPEHHHPLGFRRKENQEGWLTIEDIDYLTLILIYAIIREAWERNLLVLGIVKDTAANELVKTVIPILEDAKLLRFEKDLPRFESDKMLLQANSVMNSIEIATPWRTFEYDVCFRTISPEEKKILGSGESRVRGAFRNVIATERLFVKAYFQLWSSTKDPNVRSYVFLYDRPCYSQYDMPENPNSPELLLRHKDVVEERIVPAIHFLTDSPLSNLVIGVLYSMGTEAIPEALGHNYPLFLADKKAKWIEAEAAKACTAAVELEVSRSKLDQQMLYEEKFRDYRDSVEGKRRSRNRGSKRA